MMNKPTHGQGSVYQRRRRNALKRKALTLYKKGYSTREVGGMIAKSHQWVARVIRESNAR